MCDLTVIIHVLWCFVCVNVNGRSGFCPLFVDGRGEDGAKIYKDKGVFSGYEILVGLCVCVVI